jgi:alkanesulfonate monooxygenase SsuD/methylene tetrahydromethanopterin reductase-like flavin-dependent oxidoreductase (luciferase family)
MTTPATLVDFGFHGFVPGLAPLAERLGFARYWLGEHHAFDQVSNPLLMCGVLAGCTRDLRIGSAGVCLPLHAPLTVAEDALTVDLLSRGRLDLGVCAGMAGDPQLMQALRDGRRTRQDEFAKKVRRLAALLDQRRAAAAGEPGPTLWVLGSSERTARLAGELGAAFAFSQHHNFAGLDPAAVIASYRAGFRPAPGRRDPRVMLVVSGICRSTEAQAGVLRGRLLDGRPQARLPGLFGSVDQFAAQLAALAGPSSPDELGVIDLSFAFGADAAAFGERDASLHHLARALGLGAATGAPARRPRLPASGGQIRAT